MEVVTFSVLSAFVVQALCLVSYIYYKRYMAGLQVSKETEEKEEKKEEKKTKANVKKIKRKKAQAPRKKTVAQDLDESDTESQTMEDQLAHIIMKENFIQDSINTTAVNAKPTVKKFTATQVQKQQPQKSKNHKKSLNRFEATEEELDWESVTNRKHKKKIEASNPRENVFRFTLDEEGGVAEIPFCEIHFPAESVTKPLMVTLEIEKFKKFVDDNEEKVFLTPAAHFVTSGDSKLKRRFTMHLNTMRMMGRGWDGSVCGQIETRGADGTWTAFGRVEYVFGKPIQIVHDSLSSFRVVITRGQNGSITRSLSVAAYIQKSKMQNPNFHVIHLCVYDKSSQSAYKVETNMQKNVLKMAPRDCDVQFGSDLQFKIQPTQKFTPEEKEVFIRWTEICKANFNVRFQVRLTRNEVKDKNYEAEYRTVVYLNILKVGSTLTMTQEEYFHFYWISGNIFTGKKYWTNQKNAIKGTKEKEEKSSEDDGFASGSDLASSEAEKTTQSSSLPMSPNRSPTVNRAQSIPITTTEDFVATGKKMNKRKRKKVKQSPSTQDNNSTPANVLEPAKAIKGSLPVPRYDKDGFETVRRSNKPLPDQKMSGVSTTKKPSKNTPPAPKPQSAHNKKLESKQKPPHDPTVPVATDVTNATNDLRASDRTGARRSNKGKKFYDQTATNVTGTTSAPSATKVTDASAEKSQNRTPGARGTTGGSQTVPRDTRSTTTTGRKDQVHSDRPQRYGYKPQPPVTGKPYKSGLTRDSGASGDHGGPRSTTGPKDRNTSTTRTTSGSDVSGTNNTTAPRGTSSKYHSSNVNQRGEAHQRPKPYVGPKDPQKPQGRARPYQNGPPLQSQKQPQNDSHPRPPQDPAPMSSPVNSQKTSPIPQTDTSSSNFERQSNYRKPNPNNHDFRAPYQSGPHGPQKPRTDTKDPPRSTANSNNPTSDNPGPRATFDNSSPPKDRRPRPRWNRRKGNENRVQQSVEGKN